MNRSAVAPVSIQTRAEIAARLESRRPEIEEAILTRVSAVSDAALDTDATYLQGLRAAIGAVIGFGLAGIELGEERCGPVPPAALTQARYAARLRVGLPVVLRRYTAGYSALSDFLMQEMGGEGAGVSPAELYRLQRELTALFDRLLETVSAEYEDASRHVAPSERHAQRVRRLLAGELIDTAELDYDFDAHHLGLIATGSGAQELLRELASRFHCRLLLIEGDEGAVWAWLGAPQSLDPAALCELPPTLWPEHTSLSIGEPAQELRGWRLTHRQAGAASSVAARHRQRLTRYADIAVLASILRDDGLVEFLTDTYLAPLCAERDGGEALRRTLRAYFASARNVSSTAAALGVSRKTVNNRIHTIESRLGRLISTCAADLELGLCLDQLADPPTS